MDLKKEIEKSKKLRGLLNSIEDSRGIAEEFGIEIKVFSKGVELKPS